MTKSKYADLYFFQSYKSVRWYIGNYCKENKIGQPAAKIAEMFSYLCDLERTVRGGLRGEWFYVTSKKIACPISGLGVGPSEQKRLIKHLVDLRLVEKETKKVKIGGQTKTVRHIKIMYAKVDELNDEFMELWIAKHGTDSPTRGREVVVTGDHSSHVTTTLGPHVTTTLGPPVVPLKKKQEEETRKEETRKEETISPQVENISSKKDNLSSWKNPKPSTPSQTAHECAAKLAPLVSSKERRRYGFQHLEAQLCGFLESGLFSEEILTTSVHWGVSTYGEKFTKRFTALEDLEDVLNSWWTCAPMNPVVNKPKLSAEEIAERRRERELEAELDRESMRYKPAWERGDITLEDLAEELML